MTGRRDFLSKLALRPDSCDTDFGGKLLFGCKNHFTFKWITDDFPLRFDNFNMRYFHVEVERQVLRAVRTQEGWTE